MMTVTHGIVGGITSVDTFEVQATSFLVGETLSYDIYADIGNVIRTDYGDGNEILTTITTSPQTIVDDTISTVNMTVKSNGTVSRVIFNSATDNYDTVSLIQLDGMTSLESACFGLTNLTSFSAVDTSAILNMSSICFNCSSLVSFPLIETSSVTNLQSAWSGCSGLLSFPLLDVSSCIDFGGAWTSCSSLTSFPALDMALGVIFTSTWRFCSNLLSFPVIDTSSGTGFQLTWGGCGSLVCLSAVNTLLQTITTDMFLNTPALTNPTPSEQTAILAGSNYVNAGACG